MTMKNLGSLMLYEAFYLTPGLSCCVEEILCFCSLERYFTRDAKINLNRYIEQKIVQNAEECLDSCLRNHNCDTFGYCRNGTSILCELIDSHCSSTYHDVGTHGCFYGDLTKKASIFLF